MPPLPSRAEILLERLGKGSWLFKHDAHLDLPGFVQAAQSAEPKRYIQHIALTYRGEIFDFELGVPRPMPRGWNIHV
jgi:hypothetical protein